MEPGLLALEAARRQSVDWSLPVTAAAQAAARDIAYAFGYVRPESGTYRAIQAVLHQLENPSSFSGNRDAWEKHGAGRGTFKKWKKTLTAVLGTVVVDDDDPTWLQRWIRVPQDWRSRKTARLCSARRSSWLVRPRSLSSRMICFGPMQRQHRA